MSLRLRLALGAAAAMALGMALASVLVYSAVRDQLTDQIDQALRQRAGQIEARPLADPPRPARLRVVEAPPGRARGYVQVLSADGLRTWPADATLRLPSEARDLAVAGGREEAFIRDVSGGGQPLRMITSPITGERAIQIALPLDQMRATLGRLRWVLAAIAAGVTILVALLTRAVAGGLLTPLRRLDQTAAAVANTGDLGRRIELGGRDEVGRLAATFNEMMGALERSQQAQRNLVMDASHELRTPLTALRTNIEVLAEVGDDLEPTERGRMIADITAQLEDLSRLVTDVVALARGSEPEEEPVELRLDALVEEVAARMARDARDRRLALDLDPTPVRGAPGQLERAVGNLLDNAVKWSPPGAPVDVRLRDGALTVRDRGPGIAEADLPHIFDRFYRSAEARRLPGSGLGLAIVRQAAEAHGGSVAAANHPEGGAVLTLRLPAPAR